MKKIGILLHVNDLYAPGWEEFVWGRPERNELGSGTKFVETLLDIPTDDEVYPIIFSGATTKDGLTEGEYTKQFILSRIDRLAEFPRLKAKMESMSTEALEVFERRMRTNIFASTEIKNTQHEVDHTALYFNETQPVDLVYQIASPIHAPRCFKSQLVARSEGRMRIDQPWNMLASDVCFPDTTMADVLIVEPSHRSDDPMTGAKQTLGSVLAPFFHMPAEDKVRFIKAVDGEMHKTIGSTKE